MACFPLLLQAAVSNHRLCVSSEFMSAFLRIATHLVVLARNLCIFWLALNQNFMPFAANTHKHLCTLVQSLLCWYQRRYQLVPSVL